MPKRKLTRQEIMLRALELAPLIRKVEQLRLHEGISRRETARRLNVSQYQVRKIEKTAIRMLRKFFEQRRWALQWPQDAHSRKQWMT